MAANPLTVAVLFPDSPNVVELASASWADTGGGMTRATNVTRATGEIEEINFLMFGYRRLTNPDDTIDFATDG